MGVQTPACILMSQRCDFVPYTKSLIISHVLYDSIMMLPGEGEAYDACTEVVGWKKCPVCGYSEPMTQNCARVTCPVCYTHWVKKSAKRVSARIHGFSETAKALALSDDERNLWFYPKVSKDRENSPNLHT